MIRRYALAFGCSSTVHLLAVLLAIWIASPGRPPAAAKASRAITVFSVASTEDAAYPGLNPIDRIERDWKFPHDDGSSSLRIEGFRIDVNTIADRARVLFPFLTPGLSLEHFFVTPQLDTRPRLRNPLQTAGWERKATPPLVLTDTALQGMVDRSWARRDRWAAFQPISRLAETSDPNAGRLPDLLQQYRDQNSLQPYTDSTTRDPRLWAQLGLAADHVRFIGFIRRYTSEHPSTRATTELLFLLDKIAEASRDALGVLLDSDPAGYLAWTRQANPRAYQLVREIRRYYRDELTRRALFSQEAITRYYETTRLAILRGIVGSTPDGYRANDARFLAGAIYWRQQRTEDALRSWAEMVVNQNDSHAVVISNLIAALRGRNDQRKAGDGQRIDPALRREIDQILKNDQGRWVMFSYDRLRRFGYRFDSF
jgi:hypothetical protein